MNGSIQQLSASHGALSQKHPITTAIIATQLDTSSLAAPGQKSTINSNRGQEIKKLERTLQELKSVQKQLQKGFKVRQDDTAMATNQSFPAQRFKSNL